MKTAKKIMTITLAGVILTTVMLSGCTGRKDIGAQSGSVKVKFFANFTLPEKDADKAWAEAVEKATGVKLEFEIPPSTGYNERLQIMLAQGDYPDVIFFNSQNDKAFIDAVESGVVIPINKYIDNAENLKKYTYDVSWDALKTKGDDNIYAIPRTTINRNDGYAVRLDWLEQLGITLPEDGKLTQDEFTNMLRAISKNDPDANGKNDTYGLGANTDGVGTLTPFETKSFGVTSWLQNSDGVYISSQYSKTDNSYKKALEYSAMLYREKLVDPSSSVIKSDQADERFLQGITGVQYSFAGHVYLNKYLKMKDRYPGIKLGYITGVKNSNGEVKGVGFSTGMGGLFAISKNAKNPQKIVEMFDWMLSDQGWDLTKYGVEGVSYKMEDNKMINIQDSWGRATVRRKDSSDFFLNGTFPDDWMRKSQKWLDQAIETAYFSPDRGYKAPVTSEPSYIDANKNLNVVVTKIIIGELPVSSYDEALNKWYSAGGDMLIKQMNEYINKMEKK